MFIGAHELVPVVHSHTSTDNLTDTGHEDIDTLGDTAVFGVLLHVEGLDFSGEVGEEDGLVNDVGHLALGGLGDVITELVGLAFFVGNFVLDEPLDGIGVLHAAEGTTGGLEVGVELLDEGCGLRLGQDQLNDTADHSF